MPLPRVFGHLDLVVEVSDSGARARVKPLAIPRLVESSARGLDPDRVVRLVSRICGVCSIAHQVAAVEAIEAAARYEPSEGIELLRKAILEIHAIQNAAIFLSLPAFEELKNFVSRPREVRRKLLEINSLCCKALTTLVGSFVHPPGIRVGGFPNVSQLSLRIAMKLLSDIERVSREVVEDLVLPESGFRYRATPLRVPNFVSRSFVEALDEGSWRRIALEPATLNRVLELEPPPFTGARARSVGTFMPLAAAEDPSYSIPARLAEIPRLATEALELLERCGNVSFDRIEVSSGFGIAAVEAPRGVLIHAYEFERGLVKSCRIATPTQISLRFLEVCASAMASSLASSGASLEEIEGVVQSFVRSFDPCIPCAVKVVRVGVR